jgi:photosystem II stability/assembly factor-like uncharacterized protein
MRHPDGLRNAPQPPPPPGLGHVDAVDLNPADGLIYAATHFGVFRLRPQQPEQIANRHQDTMGFTIIGPDLFLGSGHPDVREPGPSHLGLVSSTDRALTWKQVALAGEADFHALFAAGATIYGLDVTDGVLMRSDDNGQNWQRGAELGDADLDVDPDDPLRVLATTDRGLMESQDGGMSFAAVAAQPPLLVLIDHVDHVDYAGGDREPNLVGIDPNGEVWARSGDGWAQAGLLPGPPRAFTVLGADRYLAATEEAVLRSDDAGRTWSTVAEIGP